MANFGLPTEPLLIFWSGDLSIIIQSVPIMKEGKPYNLLFLKLSEDVLQRYKLDPDKFEIPGIFVKAYPANYIYNLSLNPYSQIYICMTNFDGTKSIESEIQRILEQNTQLKDTANIAFMENESLRIRLKMAYEQLNEFQESETQEQG